MSFFTGQIVRHKGERKVVKRVYYDMLHRYTVEFVDLTKCIDMKDIEIDG